MRRISLLAVLAILCCLTAFVPANAQDAKLFSLLESNTKKIDAAFLKGDLTPVLNLFSATAMITNPAGAFVHREDVADSLRSGVLKYTSAEISEEKLAHFGDAAVFNYLSTEAGTMQGHDISGKYRYTQVWVRQAGEWKIVAVQITPVLS